MSDELQTAASTPQNQSAPATIMDFFIKIPPIVRKLFLIVAALLIFQIPLTLVKELVEEREYNYKSVQINIASGWGEIDPLISPPRYDSLLPDDYKVSVELFPEVRYRGIYQTVTYKANIQQVMTWDMKDKKERIVSWPNRTARDVVVTVNGNPVPVSKAENGYKFEIPPTENGKVQCHISAHLMGAQSILFTPYGQLQVKGAWGAPGFEGSTLPFKRQIKSDFFSAEWDFSHTMNMSNAVVKLHLPGSDYASITRLLRYGTLFLIIFFIAFMMAECFCKVEVHSVQYLINALSPVLFYLMLLAFAEKCGFAVSYMISTAVVIALTVFYSRMIFDRLKTALILGGVFTVSYIVNYLILKMEDMALITGTIILIVVLAFLMYITGRLNRK